MMRRCVAVFLLLAAGGLPAFAQTRVLSLTDARDIAIRNHPRMAAAALSAQAAQSVVREARAAYFPTVVGNVTGVGAEDAATVTAGAIVTSSLYSRAASGLAASQLLADFGRTAKLEDAAALRTSAAERLVDDTRARVTLEVDTAYYQTLAAQSILDVARATLLLRRVTLRQVTALAQNGLRSTLDLSFAQVTVSEAELALSRAESEASGAHTRLSASLGYERDEPFTLVPDVPLPAPADDPQPLIDRAVRTRPDLAALRLSHEALEQFSVAERRLRNPTITAAAVVGAAPVRDDCLRDTYGAVGVNLSIPMLNGGLFAARRTEAALRAAAADKDVQAFALQVARDVRIAWLDTTDAYRRLDVTMRLVAEAAEALRLAQARYDSGLGSIVELTQAQVNASGAQIAAASAKYEYLSKNSTLTFLVGDRP